MNTIKIKMKVNRVSVLLLATSLIINAALALVGPFFPREAEEKGVDINIIGYIFSAYPLCFVIVSLIMPKILNCHSQRNVFKFGSFVYAVSVIGFGLLIYVPDEYFLMSALLFRIMQGGSNAAVYTTAYSVFSHQYAGQDIMKINSYFKSTLGLGLVTGLLTGTLLYMIGGYSLPFVVFGLFFLGFIPGVMNYFPENIGEGEGLQERLFPSAKTDTWRKTSNEHQESPVRELPKDVSERVYSQYNYKKSPLNHVPQPKYSFDNRYTNHIQDCESGSMSPRDSSRKLKELINQEYENPDEGFFEAIITKVIVKCLLLSIVFLSLLNFAPAILSKRLSELNIHEYLYGLIFAIPCIVPVWSIFLANQLTSKLNGNVTLLTGTVLMSFGFFVVAVESVICFLIGISILGFAAPFTILPLFPMMRNSLNKENRDSNKIINTLSGLYNAALGIGAIWGPLIGANLYYYFEFSTTAYILGNAWIVLSITLFWTGGWWRSQASEVELSELSDVDLPSYNNGSFLEPNIIPIPKGKIFNDFNKPRFNSQ